MATLNENGVKHEEKKKVKRRKFERALPGPSKKNTRDDAGRVVVRVMLADPDKKKGTWHKPGNIVRSLTVKDSKVSEVFSFIASSLFGEEP